MWLLQQSVLAYMLNAIERGFSPSAEQRADFGREIVSAADTSRVLSIAGKTAQINIKGVLTKEPDIMAYFFGGGNTTYGTIEAALAEAEADKSISEIYLYIDSPGGTVAGLFELIAAMQQVKKPTHAVVSLAASAAYAIAAEADDITAVGPASRFGSIGVAQSFYVSDDEIDITSTKAPRKRPDVKTPEGQAMVREELDALHDLFVESIASGRGVTINDVNENFGQGGVLLAAEAKKRGMIDKIAVKSPAVARSPRGATTSETKPMDLKTLKAEHPEAYAAAVAEGTNVERDRVCAFLTAGKMSKDMTTAINAIESGSEMTLSLQTKFLMASANNANINARQEDDTDAAAALAGASSADAAQDKARAAEKVAKMALSQLGFGEGE